jgi:hypothetical protein
MSNQEDPKDWTQATAPKAKANIGLILLGVIVLGVGGGLVWFQMKNGNQKLVLEKCCNDILLGPKSALFVRAETPVRTQPSLDDGRTAYTYKRGVTVMGEVVLGADGQSKWLKQQGDGWFIETKDLSTGAPPRLTGPRPAPNVVSSTPVELRQIPDAKAPVMVTLPAGTPLEQIGTDKNGFVEVVFEHPVYRVGYVVPARP